MMKLVCTLTIFLVTVACANGGKARIVGGAHAPEMVFPFQISLQRGGSHNCGGSILNTKWILTAAHCVVSNGIEPAPAEEFNVQAGSIQLYEGGVNHKVKRVIVHEDYGNFLNDLALLELTEPLQMSQGIRSIPLLEDEVPSNENIIISGWGRVGTRENISYTLKYNWLKALNQEECGNLIGWNRQELICLAHDKDNGACMGDSGGPAVYEHKLAGVASFVVGGCGSNNPDAYVKVSHYLDWIKENMQE